MVSDGISSGLSGRQQMRARALCIHSAAQHTCSTQLTIDASTLNLTFLSLFLEMRANISSIAWGTIPLSSP